MSSILDQYTQPHRPDEEPESGDAAPATSLVADGALVRLVGSVAAMLDFRFKGGKRLSLPYSYLSSVSYDPKSGITLTYPSHTMTVRGRNLGPAYNAIGSLTALALVESDTGVDEGGDEPFIEAIAVDQADSQ